VTLRVDGELVSRPYIELTLAVMRPFGVAVDAGDFRRFEIPRRHYTAIDYAVEPDASAASYFFAAAAITGGEVTVDGLGHDSLQGDIRFCDCLAQMGCEVRYERNKTTVIGRPLVGIEMNMNAISDTVQTLAAVALFADEPTTITGVGHIRHKETDRIGNLAIELRKLGALVEELPDGLRITPAALHGALIETYDDHRMAMSLSLVGLRVPGVVILDAPSTENYYPALLRYLSRIAVLTIHFAPRSGTAAFPRGAWERGATRGLAQA
jgi:3-phosphoshikimate 1-carboxyvinyltransferase